jgi:hypothetical protein
MARGVHPVARRREKGKMIVPFMGTSDGDK